MRFNQCTAALEDGLSPLIAEVYNAAGYQPGQGMSYTVLECALRKMWIKPCAERVINSKKLFLTIGREDNADLKRILDTLKKLWMQKGQNQELLESLERTIQNYQRWQTDFEKSLTETQNFLQEIQQKPIEEIDATLEDQADRKWELLAIQSKEFKSLHKELEGLLSQLVDPLLYEHHMRQYKAGKAVTEPQVGTKYYESDPAKALKDLSVILEEQEKSGNSISIDEMTGAGNRNLPRSKSANDINNNMSSKHL